MATVDLQADDAGLGDRFVGLGVIHRLVAVDPNLHTKPLATDDVDVLGKIPVADDSPDEDEQMGPMADKKPDHDVFGQTHIRAPSSVKSGLVKARSFRPCSRPIEVTARRSWTGIPYSHAFCRMRQNKIHFSERAAGAEARLGGVFRRGRVIGHPSAQVTPTLAVLAQSRTSEVTSTDARNDQKTTAPAVI